MGNNKHLGLLHPNNLNPSGLQAKCEPYGDAKSLNNSRDVEKPSPPHKTTQRPEVSEITKQKDVK